jgi:hypothetical protein
LCGGPTTSIICLRSPHFFPQAASCSLGSGEVVASKRDTFGELHRVARRRGQRGHFTTVQAEAAGISRTRLSHLVKRGLVVRVATGVYRFRVAANTTWRDRLAVELLSTGGMASGLSASALYGLAEPPTRPCVMLARGNRAARHTRHTTRDLPRCDCAIVDGMRALAPARAVIDSVHRLPYGDAVVLVERAIVRGLVNPETLRRRAKELSHSKRPGCAVTLRILADLHPELSRSRNEWEALVARRAKQFGLQQPELEYQLTINGHRYFADAAWPDQRVALEFDGRDPHMRRKVHDQDSVRRNDFNDAEWAHFSITAVALKRRDDRAFAQVARAIARRSLPGIDSSRHLLQTDARGRGGE